MTRRRTILFLCTGDTCRGPMAVGFLRKLMCDAGIKAIEARSSGVMTVNGLLATSESMQMLAHEGVELGRHRSTPMSEELLRRCDLILGMTPLHIQQALRMEPSIRGKAFLLKEYAGTDLKKVQIDDPMGNTLEVYKRVFGEIRAACLKLMTRSFITGRASKEPLPSESRALRAAGKVKPKAAVPAKSAGKAAGKGADVKKPQAKAAASHKAVAPKKAAPAKKAVAPVKVVAPAKSGGREKSAAGSHKRH